MKNVSKAESYAPSAHYVDRCIQEIKTALPGTFLPADVKPEISETLLDHFNHYLEQGRLSVSHNECMRYIEYCSGFVGALTISHQITVPEHQKMWDQINMVRDASFAAWIKGERS